MVKIFCGAPCSWVLKSGLQYTYFSLLFSRDCADICRGCHRRAHGANISLITRVLTIKIFYTIALILHCKLLLFTVARNAGRVWRFRWSSRSGKRRSYWIQPSWDRLWTIWWLWRRHCEKHLEWTSLRRWRYRNVLECTSF